MFVCLIDRDRLSLDELSDDTNIESIIKSPSLLSPQDIDTESKKQLHKMPEEDEISKMTGLPENENVQLPSVVVAADDENSTQPASPVSFEMSEEDKANVEAPILTANSENVTPELPPPTEILMGANENDETVIPVDDNLIATPEQNTNSFSESEKVESVAMAQEIENLNESSSAIAEEPSSEDAVCEKVIDSLPEPVPVQASTGSVETSMGIDRVPLPGPSATDVDVESHADGEQHTSPTMMTAVQTNSDESLQQLSILPLPENAEDMAKKDTLDEEKTEKIDENNDKREKDEAVASNSLEKIQSMANAGAELIP